MISIEEKVVVGAGAEEVWAVLKVPDAVVRCVPGAQLKGEKSPGHFDAGISIKFGPTVANFSGVAVVAYDDDARKCTVSGRGNDKRGNSPATGSGVLTVEAVDQESCTLTIQGSFEVSGPLEPFIDTGGVFVARALLAQFAENLSKLVKSLQDDPEQVSELSLGSDAAVPLKASALIGSIAAERTGALRSWLLERKKNV